MDFKKYVARLGEPPRSPAIAEGIKNIVIRIATEIRAPYGQGEDMDLDNVFNGLCEYTRAEGFEYNPSSEGIAKALETKKIDCGSASQLVTGVMLYVANRNLSVNPTDDPSIEGLSYGIFGGLRPVLTPILYNPGVRFTNNLLGGGGRAYFTGGHFVSVIEDTQYDLITSLHAPAIGFIQARPGDDGRKVCTVAGDLRTFTPLNTTTEQGLGKYSIYPTL
jgi:hypothetical protein